MHAVIKALEGAKAVFIHDHLGHCLEEAAGPLQGRRMKSW
jgi:DNA-binding FrmR family transcriptional regulator